MRMHYSTLGDFVPGSYTVPQNPVLMLKQNGMGDFVPAWFPVPQNPVRDAMGLSGLSGPGCWFFDDRAPYDLGTRGMFQDSQEVCIRGGYDTGALSGLSVPGCWYWDDVPPYDLMSQGLIRDGLQCIRGGYHTGASRALNGLGCGCGGGCGGKCGGIGAIDLSPMGTGIVASLGSSLGMTTLPAIPNWAVYGIGALVAVMAFSGGTRGRRRR